MNTVILSGFLATEPEKRRTDSGKSVTSFRIAVRRPRTKDKTDFISCVAWESTADFIEDHFRKGSGIELVGSINVRDYQDRDGKKRYITEVCISSVEFGKRGSPDTPDDRSRTTQNNTGSDAHQRYGSYEPINDDDAKFPF